MQWEISFPSAIAIGPDGIAAGAAAQAAGKSIACAKTAPKPNANGAVKFVCILSGGLKPIGNGPIAVVHYRLQTDLQGAPIRIPIENILAVSADLTIIPMPNLDVIIPTA